MQRTLPLLLSGAVLAPAAAAAQEIEYWMWDPRQMPVYQQCADAFEAENPGITVKIVQDGWDNYWTTLTTGFISGDAPDVFVNHVSRFPEYLSSGVMVDLTPLIAANGYDMSGFIPGLAESWNRNGSQYGMPKDWDTVALVYNKEMLDEAGLTPADLDDLTWNPQDGGTFEDVLARLTVDAAGRRGDEADFNPDTVDTFGLVLNPISSFGQTEWSYLAASTGFEFIDAPWGTAYHLDDPRLADTLTWMRDLGYEKGLMPTAELSGRLGGETLLIARKGAMTVHGSWMIAWLAENTPFEVGFAPIPIGPEGRRSMFNGLADSIWSGSPDQEAAWAWVKFLGSAECQQIVGESGVVFPGRPEAVDAALATYESRGLDVTAFTDVANPETTFPMPLTDRGNEVAQIVKGALERIMLNQGDPAEILKSANEEVNTLF
jgi:multiple sugar transport system substrate-binding protein